jgi:hypothetical protein
VVRVLQVAAHRRDLMMLELAARATPYLLCASDGTDFGIKTVITSLKFLRFVNRFSNCWHGKDTAALRLYFVDHMGPAFR